MGDMTIRGFWCGATRQCWTAESECTGHGQCNTWDTAWCAVYETGVDSYPERLMCGVERHDCIALVDGIRGATAHNHGECIRRTVTR
jgi:hypothetical protein